MEEEDVGRLLRPDSIFEDVDDCSSRDLIATFGDVTLTHRVVWRHGLQGWCLNSLQRAIRLGHVEMTRFLLSFDELRDRHLKSLLDATIATPAHYETLWASLQ